MGWSWRSLWLFVPGSLAVAAAGWLWLATGGFLPPHPRRRTNLVVPAFVLILIGRVLHVGRCQKLEHPLARPAPSSGPASGGGSRFVEQVPSAAATCRQQG